MNGCGHGVNGFRGRETSKKIAKSKTPHVNPTRGAPKFVFEFVVRATRRDERAGRGETKGRTAHPPQIFYNPGATSFFS